MSVKDIYSVKKIKPIETHDWLINKHYAGRVPVIMHSFGIFDNLLQGVCTFGNGARLLHKSVCYDSEDIEHYELNRLVVNDDIKDNALSYFVSRCIKLMPKNSILVSYADASNGHHGYIYQATNWIYLGKNKADKIYINESTGETFHGHTIVDKYGSRSKSELPDHISIISESDGKHKYVYFNGDKRFKNKCRDKLKVQPKEYPKGDNTKYDASYTPQTQIDLF